MSRSRRFGSFSRQRASSRLIDAGVAAGNAVQSTFARDDGGDDVGDGLAGERAAAGEHFIEDDAERPDVRALVDRSALGLFGRHVGGRSEDHAERRGVSR